MICIISLFLELFFNRFISSNSYFIPLFTLVSLIYLKKDDKYLLKVSTLGFIYDLIFTNYYFLHTFIFFIIGLVIRNRFIKNDIILTILIIIIYNVFLFTIYNLSKENILSLYDFIFVIKHFFFINILYSLLISFIDHKNRIKA